MKSKLVSSLTLKNVFITFTFLIATFPLLPYAIRSILIASWATLGLMLFFKTKSTFRIDINLILFILPFIVLSLTMMYSKNINYATKTLVKMLPLLIFPIIFSLNSNLFNQKKIKKIVSVFVYAVIILILYQLFQVALNYEFITNDITLREVLNNGYKSVNEISQDKKDVIKLRRFRHFIIDKSRAHPTYQGLWISFSIIFLSLQLKTNNNLKRVINSIFILLLFLWLLWISARMPLISLITSSILTVIIFSKFNIKHKLLFLSISFGLILSLIFFKTPFSVRLKEYYSTGFTTLNKDSKHNELNSSNIRNGIYFCDIELIKTSPFFGYGIGDIQDELNNCFKEKLGAKVYNKGGFNTHNQYAFFWLSSGIIGFLSIITLLATIFIKSIKINKKILFNVIILCALIFMTENILQRSNGIFFFSFFCSILFFNKRIYN